MTQPANAPAATDVQEADDDEGGGLRLSVSLEEKVEIARTAATRIFELLGAGMPEIQVAIEDDQVVVHLQGLAPQLAPQGDNRTLESLQFILNKAINKLALQRTRLSLDADGFRRRRPEGLERIADQLVAKALQLGKPIAIGPLHPGDLRILSQQAVRNEAIRAQPFGQHERRRLVLSPIAVQGAEAEAEDDEGTDAAAAGGAGRRRRRRRR
jgi:predicted RNA-binding protein Jag